MADKKISELPAAESLESTDLMMVAQENVSSSSGYVSMKTTAADVADEFNTELTYNDLNTTDKTIVGSINEVKDIAEGMVEANPAGSASTALDKIKIGNTTYEIEDTGSIVSVFQTLGTGTEIGSITVDNVETKFYAPTPTEVTANPQGTSSIDLEKISIGGSIYNIPQGSSTVTDLEDLDNVTITTPTDGQVLKYNDSTHEWINAAESGGGSGTLVGLTDTNISSPAAGQDLSYDSTSSKWINKTHRVELTKAEYDALPSSKLTDGIEYFITDMETTGTEIVANPEDTATDTLTKLQIGNEVYNISGSSSGGHTILDNDGTSLTQRDDLQFIGAYVNDDSTNEITKVNVIREMTKAQFNLLSDAEKVGLIRVTDEDDGIGSGYRETVLWSGSETPTVGTPYTATLSDSIENYDAIAILCKNYQGDEYYNLPIFLTSEFIIDRHFEGSHLQYSPAYDLWRLSNTTISLGLYTSQSSVIYEKIIGINFGGNSSSPLNYSTAEQKTGQKWIDGKDIYQKTFIITSSDVTFSSYTTYNHGIANFGKVLNYNGYVTYPTDFRTFPSTTNDTRYNIGLSDYTSTQFGFSFGGSTISNIVNLTFTVQYTKTT